MSGILVVVGKSIKNINKQTNNKEERLCLCTVATYMSESVKCEIITAMLLQFKFSGM
jgi:hypothetical protein